MRHLSEDLSKAIADRLKVGELGRPACRVEIDRLSFIPGREEKLEFIQVTERTEKVIEREWIEGEGSTEVSTSSFQFPVAGRTLMNTTRRFSDTHQGHDIGAPKGTDVFAVLGGTVLQTVRGNLYDGYGLYIDIKHADGLITRYAHLSEISVSRGQTVSRGQVIGKIGNTGNVRAMRDGRWAIPTGTFDDPTSERSQGRGSHLHFEVHVTKSGGGTTRVNPEPYLRGSITQTTGITNTGNVVKAGQARGFPRRIMHQRFNTVHWHRNNKFVVGIFPPLLYDVWADVVPGVSFGSSSPLLRVTFPETPPATVPLTMSLNFKVNLMFEGYLKFAYATDAAHIIDGVRVIVNGKVARDVNRYPIAARGRLITITDVHLPKGEVNLTLRFYKASTAKRMFALSFVSVYELVSLGAVGINVNDPNAITPNTIAPTPSGFWQETIRDVITPDWENVYKDIQVGDFVYMDTLTLDNVFGIELDTQFEAETTEARITISNPDSFYSPDYDPTMFMENSLDSPWSQLVNGLRVGVIAENAPVRIYLGYGLHSERVFTGLVDKVDIMDGMITIFCRDMYKKIINKVLTETKSYPEEINPEGENAEKLVWVKSSVVHDLVHHAGMFGWRAAYNDLYYPDAIIEETYLIEADQKTGKVIKAVPDKEGEFVAVDMEAILTPQGWKNPFVEVGGKQFLAFHHRVSECIAEVMRDTNFRSYCDRYGTYRLEQIRLNNPVVAEFSERENLVALVKSFDYSRARSHLVIYDGEGGFDNFVDKELLMELKGEVRTATIVVPWATSRESKKLVAERLFFDMKRVCRTLQASIVGNPLLNVLDRVRVIDHNTSTHSVYTIKGIRSSFSTEVGYIQVMDLMWANFGVMR